MSERAKLSRSNDESAKPARQEEPKPVKIPGSPATIPQVIFLTISTSFRWANHFDARCDVRATFTLPLFPLSKRSRDYALGGNYFDEWDRQAVQKRLVRRLEKLGYEVMLTPTAPAI